MLEFISEKLKPVITGIRDKNYGIMGNIISSHYLQKLLTEKALIKRQFDFFLSLIKDEKLTFTQEDLQLKKPYTKLYGRVSRTTVARDIKKFEDLGLILSTEDGYTFNHNMIKV